MPFPDADKLQAGAELEFRRRAERPHHQFRRHAVPEFNHTYDITDSVAKVWGSHTFKGGIYLHKSLKDQTAFTSVNGIINFDRDANNPLDSELGVLQRAARAITIPCSNPTRY